MLKKVIFGLGKQLAREERGEGAVSLDGIDVPGLRLPWPMVFLVSAGLRKWAALAGTGLTVGYMNGHKPEIKKKIIFSQ